MQDKIENCLFNIVSSLIRILESLITIIILGNYVTFFLSSELIGWRISRECRKKEPLNTIFIEEIRN